MVSPQSINRLRSSVPKAHELYISIIRNPVEQYESLCRDCYLNKAYLDLPLVPRSFTINDFHLVFGQEYNDFELNMHHMFNLYYEYWKNIKTSPHLADDLEYLDWLNEHIDEKYRSPINPDYLFRRNNQFAYLTGTFSKTIIQQMLNGSPNSILFTTSQLEEQFIWLLQNNPLLKPLTIFSEYDGIYTKSEIQNQLKLARTNITPQIVNNQNLRLDTRESYLYTILNQIDFNIWFSTSTRWNDKLRPQ